MANNKNDQTNEPAKTRKVHEGPKKTNAYYVREMERVAKEFTESAPGSPELAALRREYIKLYTPWSESNDKALAELTTDKTKFDAIMDSMLS